MINMTATSVLDLSASQPRVLARPNSSGRLLAVLLLICVQGRSVVDLVSDNDRHLEEGLRLTAPSPSLAGDLSRGSGDDEADSGGGDGGVLRRRKSESKAAPSPWWTLGSCGRRYRAAEGGVASTGLRRRGNREVVATNGGASASSGLLAQPAAGARVADEPSPSPAVLSVRGEDPAGARVAATSEASAAPRLAASQAAAAAPSGMLQDSDGLPVLVFLNALLVQLTRDFIQSDFYEQSGDVVSSSAEFLRILEASTAILARPVTSTSSVTELLRWHVLWIVFARAEFLNRRAQADDWERRVRDKYSRSWLMRWLLLGRGQNLARVGSLYYLRM